MTVAQAEATRSATSVVERKTFSVLGVDIDCVTMPSAVAAVKAFVDSGARAHVVFCTVSSVISAHDEPLVMEALTGATLVAPDGMPLVWLGKRQKAAPLERVYGPDFMVAMLEATGGSYRHFFYGGAPGVADEMARRLTARFPGLKVVGTLSPPFRDWRDQLSVEDAAVINAARPDIVWVGMGHPKQDVWMHVNRDLIDAPVLAAVGAAFDFHSGRKQEAPEWIKRSGLQWLHRFIREPRRLWRRYLIGNAKFIYLLVASRRRAWKGP